MKIKTLQGKEFHLPKELAVVLSDAGLCTITPEKTPEPAVVATPQNIWYVKHGEMFDEISISANCPRCHQQFNLVGGTPGTSIQNFGTRFSHCGKNEPIPEFIVAEYKRFFLTAEQKEGLAEKARIQRDYTPAKTVRYV